jgi:hypothetical protein
MKNNLTEQLISQNPLSQNPGPDYTDDVVSPGFPEEGVPGTEPEDLPPADLDPANPETVPTNPDLQDNGVLNPAI